MSPLFTFVLLVVSAAVAVLAAVLVRFNRKRLHIARCAASAAPEQLERIYALVESLGTLPANGHVLARTNQRTGESRCLVPVPMDLAGFPWAGKVIEATAGKDVQFRFVDAAVSAPALAGQLYRAVRVPRHLTKKSAKERNSFDPARHVASSAELRAALAQVCPKYPAELLVYLLCAGRNSFEFEPVDQARIGSSPAWVQDPAYPSCPECRARMVLVLQLPGTLIDRKAFHRGTFYLFGCTAHPDQTRSLGQFT
jgi:hypothetical protein